MNADKINAMREIASSLQKRVKDVDRFCAAGALCEAASELERLGKLEAAVKAYLDAETIDAVEATLLDLRTTVGAKG